MLHVSFKSWAIRVPSLAVLLVFSMGINVSRMYVSSLSSTKVKLIAADTPLQDIYILISTTEDPETIKRSLVNKSPLHFYLVRAKTPGATYKVLWYRHGQNIGQRVVIKRTKVDIVVAGTMMLPVLPSQSIIMKRTLPVVPLEVLLLHKLQ